MSGGGLGRTFLRLPFLDMPGFRKVNLMGFGLRELRESELRKKIIFELDPLIRGGLEICLGGLGF